MDCLVHTIIPACLATYGLLCSSLLFPFIYFTVHNMIDWHKAHAAFAVHLVHCSHGSHGAHCLCWFTVHMGHMVHTAFAGSLSIQITCGSHHQYTWFTWYTWYTLFTWCTWFTWCTLAAFAVHLVLCPYGSHGSHGSHGTHGSHGLHGSIIYFTGDPGSAPEMVRRQRTSACSGSGSYS